MTPPELTVQRRIESTEAMTEPEKENPVQVVLEHAERGFRIGVPPAFYSRTGHFKESLRPSQLAHCIERVKN